MSKDIIYILEIINIKDNKEKEIKNDTNSIDKTDRIKIKNFEEVKGESSPKNQDIKEDSAEDITMELETKINKTADS